MKMQEKHVSTVVKLVIFQVTAHHLLIETLVKVRKQMGNHVFYVEIMAI